MAYTLPLYVVYVPPTHVYICSMYEHTRYIIYVYLLLIYRSVVTAQATGRAKQVQGR